MINHSCICRFCTAPHNSSRTCLYKITLSLQYRVTSITVTVFDFGIFLHSKWAVKYNTGIDLFGGIISRFCIYWYSTVMTNEEKISSIVHFALFQLLREQRFESLFFPTLKLFIKMHFLYETCHNMFFYYQTYSSTPSFHPFQMSLYIFTRFSCIDNVYSFSRYK